MLILADKKEVLWINKIGISESAKVTKTTKKVVVIYSAKEK